MSLLETRDLTAHYRDFQATSRRSTDRYALEAGETVAIIGANGAGKSTYLKSISRAAFTAIQDVVFDGEPIGALPARR